MDEGLLLALLAALAAVLGLLVVRDVARRNALARWLDHPDSDHPPRARGGWDHLHAAVVRRLRGQSRRESELLLSLEGWRKAARALPEGLVILEDEDHIAWLNDAASIHLSLDAKDVGRPLTHLVRVPAFIAYLERGDFSRPVMMAAPANPDHVVSVQVVPYGEAQRLVLTRDITQFQAVERMRREFVANVSHELRTPLTVVSGFIETLRDERDPDAARRFLDLMAAQAGRMQRLVEDLLTLSALESAPPPPMDDRVRMAGLLERLAAEARALSHGRHRIVVEPPVEMDLVGAESELASAFGNLVSNAIRYTPAGGEVRLRWRAEGDGAAFEVQDTGIGIAAEHVPRLTERFYRVDRGRSRETGGTGLGLAIVKHALARHGAWLHVASEPGSGSTFSARFAGPRVKPAESRSRD